MDTTEVAVMAEEGLHSSLYALRERGIPTDLIEVGPTTFDLCIDVMIRRREWKLMHPEVIRRQVKLGCVDLHFDGSLVVMHDDVPEGRFWPSRRRETDVYQPIPAALSA